eukprot:CAMPEP_0171172998 /NCGR_PEP_ID=MMETSP0790-20130122/10000_1 /TAXON_ID=2925 /ORGANISM="Alexandrium catenella, Strain OF101" /LENGTH=313 /DNA_ID=CAMNT_0011637857 /DNA_START=91 /DNA_END=1030 /DNA_ORIENTATION=-
MFPGDGSYGPSLMRFTANTTRLYEVLELEKCAGGAEVRKAYRKLAVRCHPDKGGDPEKFREIARAYEVLSDPEKRAKYDEFGEEGLEAGFFVPAPAADPAEPEGAPEPRSGGLALGACALAALTSAFCGISAAAGVALCGAGHALRAGEGGRHRVTAAALTLGGGLLLWPLLGALQGWSSVMWTGATYGATICGLGILAKQLDRLPQFLPYLLFIGYLLLFLLVPTRSAERMLVELPGYVVITDKGEVESDCALAESAAIFTWGIVAIHEVLARVSSQEGARKRDDGVAVEGDGALGLHWWAQPTAEYSSKTK